jgi:hypothetical protein
MRQRQPAEGIKTPLVYSFVLSAKNIASSTDLIMQVPDSGLNASRLHLQTPYRGYAETAAIGWSYGRCDW